MAAPVDHLKLTTRDRIALLALIVGLTAVLVAGLAALHALS